MTCVIVIDDKPYDVAAHYARKTPPMALPATATMAVLEIVLASGRPNFQGYEIAEVDERGEWIGQPYDVLTQALPLHDGQRFVVFPRSGFCRPSPAFFWSGPYDRKSAEIAAALTQEPTP